MKAKAPIHTTAGGDRLIDPDAGESGVLRYAPGDDIPDAEAKKLGLVDGAPPAKAEAATTKAQKPADDKGA